MGTVCFGKLRRCEKAGRGKVLEHVRGEVECQHKRGGEEDEGEVRQESNGNNGSEWR